MPVSQKRLTDALGYSGVLTPGHFRPTAAPVSQKRLTDEEELSFGLPASRLIRILAALHTSKRIRSHALPLLEAHSHRDLSNPPVLRTLDATPIDASFRMGASAETPRGNLLPHGSFRGNAASVV